ncbi:MAG: hypothetical protein CO093_08560 [Alphaproteobacteria bacterium CG_4_9_14_3_um_filter_47_13]|nr:MAG: hypothetical protein CO093_08560 [Alphaproteobacteria bacterium CG_4_9_14_3_um_filter_47_13]
MKHLLLIAMTALMFFPACAHAKKGNEAKQTIFVLIENGGTVEDTEAAAETAKHLLGQLTQLKNRRATRDAQIVIILSAMPNRVTWSGTPEQLLQQGQAVLDLIQFKPTFSDLVLAFQQIDTTLRLSQSDDHRLYWIGPAIHVPFSSKSDEAIKVQVPQDVPKELNLVELANMCSTFKIYNIHADQDEIYLNYLTKTGVMDAVAQGILDFAIMDAAQTTAHLDDLL